MRLRSINGLRKDRFLSIRGFCMVAIKYQFIFALLPSLILIFPVGRTKNNSRDPRPKPKKRKESQLFVSNQINSKKRTQQANRNVTIYPSKEYLFFPLKQILPASEKVYPKGWGIKCRYSVK